MPRASKKQFDAEVAKHGATVERNEGGGDGDSIRVEAPKGYRWAFGSSIYPSDEIHELVEWFGYGHTIPVGELYADLIRRMRYGLEVCNEPDCDWCNSNERMEP